jgi:hypothetical protein
MRGGRGGEAATAGARRRALTVLDGLDSEEAAALRKIIDLWWPG